MLGVTFDSKLHWSPQVSNTIRKAKRALHPLYLIKPYFAKQEMHKLVKSNCYLILYYNSEIWNIPSLHHYLLQNSAYSGFSHRS